jgi:hypothetical protein
MKRFLWILPGIILASGCASVQPWDKDILAQPYMEFRGGHKTQRFMNHAVITLEEAEGGDGSIGGACGCR